MSRYPECDKLHKASDESQTIGEFLDWLQSVKEVTLPASIYNLLSEYFEIDNDKVENEKRCILRQQKRLNDWDVP